MMKTWGKAIRNGKTVLSDTYVSGKNETADAILDSLEYFARKFDLEVPMWTSAHTKQMGVFHKVSFRADDFMDRFPYDKFELQILED